ncbi:MAG: acetyl-CoA C-acetyltransferase [Limisphaerales bacterium]|jgi:acetyl-CoA C-acetyltransferase
MREVYILSIARTPIGAFGGALASLPAHKLGSIAIASAVQRAGLKPEDIEEVFMGNVLSAGQGQAPAKQASLAAGIPDTVPTTTINKVCASGMKSIMLAAQSVMLGDCDIVVAGGMESMSNVPYYIPGARWGQRLGDGKMVDGVVFDGLWDPYGNCHMGNAGELCAKERGFSREDQDNYAIESYKRAEKALAAGSFAKEIVPVSIPQRRGDAVVVDTDEEIGKVRYDKIPTLRAAFQKEGTITAANASKLNDGAAALVLISKEKAEAMGLKPMAKILSFADASQAPEWFTTTPAKAMPKAVAKAGIEMSDVDYFEINEAFSVVALANNKELGLDAEKVNVFGGAVSLGHPIGMSGARMITTLASVLEQKGGKIGCAGICNGGGGASAMVIERL